MAAGLGALTWVQGRWLGRFLLPVLLVLSLGGAAISSYLVAFCFGIDSCLYSSFQMLIPQLRYLLLAWLPGLVMGVLGLMTLALLGAGAGRAAPSRPRA